ncbi:hypothetical protein LOK49_LG01G00177 [Camellia lanceoleosa]|uniref:Uncharacterized protein n=1 Tax=Camellia lanceoleosa TaxID=1840588 RepID=A0ACC0J007_9ERIC|nr:hypothetical protein LOK49_LG01G00177 [Camellia lanceoleosa]
MTNYVRVMLREKEKEMGAGSLMNYAVEKSKELPAAVGNMGADLMGKAEEKWKELAPNMGGDLMGRSKAVKSLSLFLESTGSSDPFVVVLSPGIRLLQS